MFPELFNDRALIEYYARWVRRTLCLIGTVLRNENHEQEIREISEWMLMHATPGNYDSRDPGNEESSQERSFENLCVLMQDNGVGNPKGETVYAFYTRIQYLNKKFKTKSQNDGTKPRNR